MSTNSVSQRRNEELPQTSCAVQCNNTGKWIEEGVIEQKRTADDSSTQSFEVRMENGNLKLRNKRFLKYATKGPDRHVQFNHQGDDQGRVHEEPDNSRGQPVLNADNAESNVSRPRTRSMDRQTV